MTSLDSGWRLKTKVQNTLALLSKPIPSEPHAPVSLLLHSLLRGWAGLGPWPPSAGGMWELTQDSTKARQPESEAALHTPRAKADASREGKVSPPLTPDHWAQLWPGGKDPGRPAPPRPGAASSGAQWGQQKSIWQGPFNRRNSPTCQVRAGQATDGSSHLRAPSSGCQLLEHKE